jgi:hypothetical protein
VALSVISRAAVFAVALGLAPAFAQQPAAPEPSAMPPPPQQAGKPGAPIPPSQFAAARALVIASGLSRSFSGAITDLSQQLVETVTRTRPDLAADLNVVMQQLAPEFDRQSDTMINNAARIYASAMTEKDLDDLVAFFNSPVGKRYVDFEPVIVANIDDVMKQWSQEVSLGMMDRVREEMKKRGHDF